MKTARTMIKPPSPGVTTYRVVFSRDGQVFLAHEEITLRKAYKLMRKYKSENFSVVKIQRMRWEDIAVSWQPHYDK